MFNSKALLLLLGSFALVMAELQETGQADADVEQNLRLKKVFPAFQFIKFPNDICNGGDRNGTCYTTDECTSKGGTNAGSCANGFGVCCVFVLSCGGTSYSNNSYLVQSTTTFSSNPCKYTICNSGSNICRIRLDFTAFTIASPVTGTTSTANGLATRVSGVGHCLTDTFKVVSIGSAGSPVICGENTGQHIIMDSSTTGCIQVIFDIGTGTSASRRWDIRVSQFACTDSSGGPPGCLQYFTGTAKTFASFNFPLTTTVVTSTFTHLANQNYDICFRRESGFCSICFSPTILPTATTTPALSFANQQSFGISNARSPTAPATSKFITQINSLCTTDYLEFIGGSNVQMTVQHVNRLCGRNFNNMPVQTTSSVQSVCSGSTPFKVTFVTDSTEDEITPFNAVIFAEELTSIIATQAVPGGIVGFMLSYQQTACA